jgi:predicted MFS family arabinose efflux permease
MNSCVAASEAVAPAKPAWRAVYSLGLGVFGLITAEFLPASLLTPMAASLGVSEEWPDRPSPPPRWWRW